MINFEKIEVIFLALPSPAVEFSVCIVCYTHIIIILSGCKSSK